MITPRVPFDPKDVAAHYDELDSFYREIWGEHVHHGLWPSRTATAEDATLGLVRAVAEQCGLSGGESVCDVGSGYGATARVLAREYGCQVTGLTISAAQYQYARAADPGETSCSYLLRDWLDNGLAPESFDVVIAIESSEHMADLHAFFFEVHRVLKPGGRFVVCAWLSSDEPGRFATRHLLEPICREGRLRGLGTASDYQTLAVAAGMTPVAFDDVSRRVKRTWSLCARRTALGLMRRPTYRRFLMHTGNRNRVFALTVLRIWLAYELGSLRYGIMTAIKPPSSVLAETHAKTRP
jgi:tocopherol O-methyltransferase